jgi:hypothetical protein
MSYFLLSLAYISHRHISRFLVRSLASKQAAFSRSSSAVTYFTLLSAQANIYLFISWCSCVGLAPAEKYLFPLSACLALLFRSPNVRNDHFN